jgi:hypothetical protein
VGTQETRILVGMLTVKTVIMMFQVEMRTLLQLDYRSFVCCMLAKYMATFFTCPETLREAEFEGSRLINL